VISFGALDDLIENGRALTIDKALFFVFSDDQMQDLVLELNTGGGIFLRGVDGQLFNDGIDSTGIKLSDLGDKLSDLGGEYAESTKIEKRAKGLPTDHITLFDEGDFYRTFNVKVGKDNIVISANTIKEGQDLQNRWGDELVGLTDESLTILIDEIIPEIIEFIKGELLR